MKDREENGLVGNDKITITIETNSKESQEVITNFVTSIKDDTLITSIKIRSAQSDKDNNISKIVADTKPAKDILEKHKDSNISKIVANTELAILKATNSNNKGNNTKEIIADTEPAKDVLEKHKDLFKKWGLKKTGKTTVNNYCSNIRTMMDCIKEHYKKDVVTIDDLKKVADKDNTQYFDIIVENSSKLQKFDTIAENSSKLQKTKKRMRDSRSGVRKFLTYLETTNSIKK